MTSRCRWARYRRLHGPKGKRVHSYVPEWQVNAVLGLSSEEMGTFQYPALQSDVRQSWASPKVSRQSSIRGKGYESRSVRSFNFRYSMQIRSLPSDLGMRTTGLAHSL